MRRHNELALLQVPEQPAFDAFWLATKNALFGLGLQCFAIPFANKDIGKATKDSEMRDIRLLAIEQSIGTLPGVEVVGVRLWVWTKTSQARPQNDSGSLESISIAVIASAMVLLALSATPLL